MEHPDHSVLEPKNVVEVSLVPTGTYPNFFVLFLLVEPFLESDLAVPSLLLSLLSVEIYETSENLWTYRV